MSIQSETVPRRPSLPCTAPARVKTWACRASASVRVDLPASGWLMTAKDRRLLACPTDSGTTLRPVAETTLVVLIALHSSAQCYVHTSCPLTPASDPADTVMRSACQTPPKPSGH